MQPTVGHIVALDNNPPDPVTADRIHSLTTRDVVKPRTRVVATDGEALTTHPTDEEAVAAVEGVDPVEAHPSITRGTPEQASRMLMLGIDPLLRRLPFEQRTAVLLNLLVTYIGEQPGLMKHRGKTINAMSDEFRGRLQHYLPLDLG